MAALLGPPPDLDALSVPEDVDGAAVTTTVSPAGR